MERGCNKLYQRHSGKAAAVFTQTTGSEERPAQLRKSFTTDFATSPLAGRQVEPRQDSPGSSHASGNSLKAVTVASVGEDRCIHLLVIMVYSQ